MKQLGTMLEDVLLLFTGYNSGGVGSAYHDGLPTKPRTAICGSGICVFIEGIVSMTTQAELLRKIHVMPGRIAHCRPGRLNSVPRDYDAVLDIVNWPNSSLDPVQIDTITSLTDVAPEGTETRESALSQSQLAPTNQMNREDEDTQHTELSITAEVVEPEDAGEITFFYRISTPIGEVIVPPGEVTMAVLASTGIVACDGFRCSKKPPETVKLLGIKSGWSLSGSDADKLDLPMTSCCDWACLGRSEVRRLAAMGSQQQQAIHGYENKIKIIVRRRECLSCCVQLASRREEQENEPGIRRRIYHII
jgi:hypothetical protein